MISLISILTEIPHCTNYGQNERSQTYITMTLPAAFVQQCEFAEARCSPQNLNVTPRARTLLGSVFNVFTQKTLRTLPRENVCVHGS